MGSENLTARINCRLSVALLLLLLAAAFFMSGGATENGQAAPAPFERRQKESQSTFTYRLVHRPNDTKPWRIVFKGAPPFIHALEMDPLRLEPKIDKGTWLVLTFCVMSVPDVMAIDIARNVVSRHGGKVNLGVRPCTSHQATRLWLPEFGEWGGSPLWVVYKDGKLQGWGVGAKTDAEVAALLAKVRR